MPTALRSRPLASIVVLLSVGALLSGCQFREREVSPPEQVSREDLPPNDVDALAAVYEDELEAFGLRLTRGSLIDTSNNTYTASDTGTHLALYVEPYTAYPPSAYLENLVPVAAVFATDVFHRWPGLMSFDVCQEPPATVDSSEEPRPDTQVNVTRAQAEDLDWESLDTAGLVAAAVEEPPGAELVISDRIRALPLYERILDEVERETGVRPN